MRQNSAPTITNEILFGLINVLIADPAAQHVRPSAAADGAAWLNPQPEPPGVGTQPEPRRAKEVSRSIISMAALAMSSAENEQAGLRRRPVIAHPA